MEHDDELNDLRLQFQALQRQQEKRKLDKKKEKEADKLNLSVSQDDLDLSKQGIQADNLEDRWVLQRSIWYVFFWYLMTNKTYIAHIRILHLEYSSPTWLNVNNQSSNKQ